MTEVATAMSEAKNLNDFEVHEKIVGIRLRFDCTGGNCVFCEMHPIPVPLTRAYEPFARL